MRHLGEQCVGERSLTRAGAASDEDVLPIDDGEAQQPGRVGRHDAVVHIVDQRVNFGRRLADRETGREADRRSEEHTSELQSLMRISYAVFCLKKKKYHYRYI